MGGVEGVAAVWAGDAAPPRLLLGVGQDVGLQVGGLGKLLVTTLQCKCNMVFSKVWRELTSNGHT